MMWQDLREIFQYRDLLVQLVRRDLSVRYKNSRLGFLWSLIPPLMQICVIWMVVKVFLRLDIPNYSAYLLVVMFPWLFFNQALLDACSIFLLHRKIVQKTYFPREILPLSSVASNLIHFLIALGLIFLYLVALRVIPGQVQWEMALLPVILVAQVALITGLALMVSGLGALYEDFKYIVSVLLTVLFYANPIMYPVEAVPERFQPWYLLNPLAMLLSAYRKVLLPPVRLPRPGGDLLGQPLEWPYFAWAIVLSLGVLALGYWVFYRLKWDMVERM